MPASSSTEHSSACTRGSSPFQKEQNGSSFGSPGSPRAPSSNPSRGSSHTRSTSQSAQCVNPTRYSTLHCGQNIPFSAHRLSLFPPVREYTTMSCCANSRRRNDLHVEDSHSKQNFLKLYGLYGKLVCGKLGAFMLAPRSTVLTARQRASR